MALSGDLYFAVRYTKGEEKVSVLDRNPWLAKMGLLWAAGRSSRTMV